MNEEINNEVFSYQVNTIMPIIGLSCGTIMVPSTVKLTKEDVLVCLKKAPVFRRFVNRKLERVTISNIDRLHNENYMTEEEYEEFLDKQNDNRGKVSEAPVVEEKKEPEPEPVVEETPVEEPVEETPVVEEVKEESVTEDSMIEETETVEEAAQIEDTIEEEVTESINDEEVSEDVTETPDLVEETDSENKVHNNRYNNKKKHNR